jgi:glycosyltransferase involved in cell wall biosynthesis
MGRIGINPARGLTSAYQPAGITLTVLTYIPSLEGYFKERLDVLKLVFASLEANTGLLHDVMVFDNGSCQAAVDYLLELKGSGKINYLLLSRQNIGKIGALKILFQAAPGKILAYCDDDIFYYPGWLEASLQILENFPSAGIVSGAPVRNASGYARTSLDAFALKPPPGISVSKERRIPDSWEIDWALSTGRDPQKHLQDTTWDDLVFRLETSSGQTIETIGCANHFQFIGKKEFLLEILPAEWSGKLMGAMVELDNTIDHLGYLRLSTNQRYTRHIGNQVSPALLDEVNLMGLDIPPEILAKINQPGSSSPHGSYSPHSFIVSRKRSNRNSKRASFILKIPGSHRILTSLYRNLFEILYLRDG